MMCPVTCAYDVLPLPGGLSTTHEAAMRPGQVVASLTSVRRRVQVCRPGHLAFSVGHDWRLTTDDF